MTATGETRKKTAATSGMAGKTVLVTGATNGIGKVAARTLAGLGARVVIVGRSQGKTAEVAREIGAASFIVADLSVMSEVRRAAAQFRDQEGRLDVLLNNAGAVVSKRQETPEGIEMTWALNHLNYFLLTQELAGTLKATPGARVVSVSSSAHTSGKMRWDDLEFRRGYSSFAAYGQSKLANILFTRELSRRLQGTGVSANALHPGFVRTGFGHNNGGMLSRVIGLLGAFAISEEQGAQTSIYLASSPEVEGVSGLYFDKQQPSKTAPQALDDAAAARLWAVSEEYVQSRTL
ncbi:SDR family oxidoreductase [Deinococcus altitudinis]|uniref:SDR family oxidoreductase n=1 Tax=Deinococcus altitudinis TaxID=468914 RepID=UPI0038912280